MDTAYRSVPICCPTSNIFCRIIMKIMRLPVITTTSSPITEFCKLYTLYYQRLLNNNYFILISILFINDFPIKV